MKVRILEKSIKRDIQTFKSLPFEIYKENSFWVPPFPGEIERVMSPSLHPFYVHSDAEFFVVESENMVLGRVAVLYNRNYNDFHQQQTAFFYYFESINDQEVSNLLLKQAEDWARERGLNQILGPKGFLRSNCMGTLVEGFDQLPAMGITYNQPYYGNLLESFGFQKDFDHFSGYLDRHPDPTIHQIAEKVLARGHFHIKSFVNTSEIADWIPRVEEVHHRAFAGNPNFYPSTPAEFEFLAKTIVAAANPEYLKLILHNGDIAGFIIAYPDINKALQRTKGRLFPFGWLSLFLEKKFTRVIDLNGIGLLPEYQGLGGNAVLYAELDKVLYASRMKKAEVVQVDERNFRSKSDMQTLGVIFNKTHRTYKKSI